MLLLGVLIIAGVLAFFAIQWYVTGVAKDYIVSEEDAPNADAVLVLGSMVYSNGQPSPLLRDRLDYGYRLYASGKADKIILSGDHGQDEYDEVNAMLAYMMSLGVPREDIFLDHAGFDTYDSMYRARDIFLADSLLICTQAFHMPRAVYIARRLGLEAYGVAAEDKEIYRMAYNRMRESLARVKAFWDVEIGQRLPKYLGDAIPVTGDGTVTDG